MKIFGVGSVVLLLSAVVQGLFPQLSFLPLGGSTIAEMGIVFGIAVAAATAHDMKSKRDD